MRRRLAVFAVALALAWLLYELAPPPEMVRRLGRAERCLEGYCSAGDTGR